LNLLNIEHILDIPTLMYTGSVSTCVILAIKDKKMFLNTLVYVLSVPLWIKDSDTTYILQRSNI